MATYPSVGRFENEQRPTFYVKCWSPKLHDLVVRKSMAPRSNHGQLTEQPTGIVDLRTVSSTTTEGKV